MVDQMGHSLADMMVERKVEWKGVLKAEVLVAM